MSYKKVIIKAGSSEKQTLSIYLPGNVTVHNRGRPKAPEPIVILEIPCFITKEESVLVKVCASKVPQIFNCFNILATRCLV